MRSRIKFCGLTRPADARAAAFAGADAIGLIFAPVSKRKVGLEQAVAIRQALPPMVSSVALLMDQSEADVLHIGQKLRPSLLQFHGSEPPEFCARLSAELGIPYIKALGVGGLALGDILGQMRQYPDAAALLLDGHRPGAAGGSGEQADLALIRDVLTQCDTGQPIVIAGGLHADNVAERLQALYATGHESCRPYAVDVSSGIELPGQPGTKCASQMQAFVAAVRAADSQTTG